MKTYQISMKTAQIFMKNLTQFNYKLNFMKRIIYSFFLTVLCSSFAYSQTFLVKGTVKSSVDNMPLPGVNIVVR